MTKKIKLENDWFLVRDFRHADREVWLLKRGRKIADRVYGPAAVTNEPGVWRGSVWAGRSAEEVAMKIIGSRKKLVAVVKAAIDNGGIAES